MDTTMGFSALDGLPMATFCGSLDAGVILYLAQEKNMSFPVKIHEQRLEAELTGDLISYVGGKNAGQLRDTYLIRFQYRQGLLLITQFQSHKEKSLEHAIASTTGQPNDPHQRGHISSDQNCMQNSIRALSHHVNQRKRKG